MFEIKNKKFTIFIFGVLLCCWQCHVLLLGALYYFLALEYMKNDARKKKLLDAPFKDEISKSRIEKERAVKNQYGEGISYIP